MERIKYFIDLTNDFLLAYEKSTEFFVRFIAKTGEWEDVNISFLDFRHDYSFREISQDEAMERTNRNLPLEAFDQYLKLINRTSEAEGK